MIGESHGPVPFAAHVELLQSFLNRRAPIVEQIQGILNARRRPVSYLQDRVRLAREFEDCVFTAAGVTADQARLRGQLEQAHWANGFTPRAMPGLHNDLMHPAEMMIRGFYCWQQSRWPGRNGRVRYAQTLFDIWLLRCLTLLSMRLWDAGADSAADRLAQIQTVLDALWAGAPADQPVFVRDARWLIPLAQSPTTEELGGYFEIAEHVAKSFDEPTRIEIQRAGVRIIGGHLTSQIRHYCIQDGVTIDDPSVVRRTRTSNALDFALLIQAMAPLLEAYERAVQSSDSQARHELAGAICQGISPDPELFVSGTELLLAYGMIEHLFVAADRDGGAAYTPMGSRYVRLMQEYATRIGRMASALSDDCARLRPVAGSYSPFGAIYGTPSNLIEHMALRTLQRGVETRFGLEDVFVDGNGRRDDRVAADDRAPVDGRGTRDVTDPSETRTAAGTGAEYSRGCGADRLTWVNGWRDLPHVDPALRRQHDYPEQFATEIFARIEQALLRRATSGADPAAAPLGRLFVRDTGTHDAGGADRIARLPARYVAASDPALVEAEQAVFCEQARVLRDRLEGHFAVSYPTAGGWAAIRKDFLTEILGTGDAAELAGLPAAAAAVLRLTCPGLIKP